MAVVIQRPLRGSRISTFYPVKNLPSLSSLDSAFQLQEYISLLIRLDVHDVDTIVSLPGASKDYAQEKEEVLKEGDKEGKVEVTVDEACWIYEQLRRLAQDLSHPLITTLQQECTRASCPEMKAGEWLYLCVAHGNDGAMEQCCAIDYILHTVDSATALLNSPRTFPSRLQIPQTSHRHFSSLARRLGRIFAHAYFHHREAFEQAEAESSLYARFLALTAKFDLVPAEFLVIPSSQFTGEDSGSDSDREQPSGRGHTDGRQNYAPQTQGEDLKSQQNATTETAQQERNSSSPPAEGTSSASGTVGESPPTSASRSRMGRSRTDTMVFTDAEASAVTDELAAKAKAGELEAEEEAHEVPATARPAVGQTQPEEVSDADLDDEQFEILLKPDELIPIAAEVTNPPHVTAEPSPEAAAEKVVEAASEKDVTEAPMDPLHEAEIPASTSELEVVLALEEKSIPEIETPSSPESLPKVKEIDFGAVEHSAPVELSAAGEEANSPAEDTEPSQTIEPTPEVSVLPSPATTLDANVDSSESSDAPPAASIPEIAEETPISPDHVPEIPNSSHVLPILSEAQSDESSEDVAPPAASEAQIKPAVLEAQPKPDGPDATVTKEHVKLTNLQQEEANLAEVHDHDEAAVVAQLLAEDAAEKPIDPEDEKPPVSDGVAPA